MSFNIDAARTAVDQNKLVFKKGDGLTHALLRVALGETAEGKEWKELQREFKALQAEQKAAIMELASELSTDNKPFYKPVAGIKEYRVEEKQYAAQSLVQPTQVSSTIIAEATPMRDNVQNPPPSLDTSQGREIGLQDFIITGDTFSLLSWKEGKIYFGGKPLSNGTQIIIYKGPSAKEHESIVVIDMQKKTITISDSPRQKLIDALNAKKKNATLGDMPDTIKISGFEVTLSQARVIERYDGKEVDIGNGRVEKKVRLATEIDSEQKSVKVFYKGGEDDFFVVNIAQDNTVTLSLKTPSLIPGFSFIKDTPTRNQIDIKNTIQSLVTQK